jgi:hypothetical protein
VGAETIFDRELIMANNLGFGNGSWTANNPFLGQDNPYLQQNIDATLGDMTRNYNTMVKPNTESSMVASGSFGNSGLQQMQQNQQYDLNSAMGKTAAGMRMQDYGNQQNMYQWDQGFNRSLYNDAYDQNMGNLNATVGLLNNMQNWNTQDINNATTLQNMPLNYWQQFTNAANAVGQGYGTTSQNTNMPGNPLLGALGGWSLGTSIGKTLG